MFTGIVQAVGTVRSIRSESTGARLTLDCAELVRPIELGASVCVSGVCLTVTADDCKSLSFDVVPETLSRSTLGTLRPGDRVNLERSLRAGDRMDGHVVQGHVDGAARVVRVSSGLEGYVLEFAVDAALLPYIIPKGSIAIDGVSLTIASVSGEHFTVAIIPTTLSMTTLGQRRVGDPVNIETDILARTVVATMERWRAGQSVDAGYVAPNFWAGSEERSGLNLGTLRENGWA